MVKPTKDNTTEPCCPPKKLKSSIPKSFAALFRSLGDETRLEMVGLLAASPGGELCVCDIEEHFQLAQPTISHHLKVLREAGAVTSERRASWVYYTLNQDALAAVGDFAAMVANNTATRRKS